MEFSSEPGFCFWIAELCSAIHGITNIIKVRIFLNDKSIASDKVDMVLVGNCQAWFGLVYFG